jgi:hypothetical protein
VNTALTGALSSLSDSSNVRPVSVWTGYAKAASDRTRVIMTWETNQAPGLARPASLEIQPIDEAGKPAMESQVIGGAPGELPMIARFDLGAGRQRMRFTVLTSSGDVIDRWILNQQVPDFSKQSLVLATPKLLRARNMLEFRAIEANATAAPTASTRFGATDRVLIEIECQSEPGLSPKVKVDLLNAKGDVLQTLHDVTLVDNRTRLALPLSSLANSTYVLRITASAGELTAEQWLAFRVQR